MVVLGEKGVKMLKYGFATPKRHILAQNRVFWRILRWCPRIAEQTMVREVGLAWKRNPLSDLNKILQGARYPRRNHLRKFWWISVKGLGVAGGQRSKFALLLWLWSSPLYPVYTIQPPTGCQTGNNRLYNRFDNQLYRVNKHPTSCHTGLTTVLNEQSLFIQPVVKPGCTTGLTTGCIHDTAGCQTGLTTVLTTGCIV